ncbi:MAG: hypothetical protein CSB46_06045 [Micrococcales bacterium]|nr:MAG: hypothetical protein CSB46_06045 [Micrococcales bacterium]
MTIRHVADFSLARREEFVRLLRLVPAGVDLADTDAEQLEALIDLCMFGFPGVWGPKVTKMAALFRPRIVPILDGYVAAAFGYQRDAFSVGGTLRRDRIRRVVEELRDILSRYRADLAELRAQVAESIPEIELISDVRILDIVIWTTQDDSISRPRKPVNAWLDAVTGERVSVQDVRPVRVAT